MSINIFIKNDSHGKTEWHLNLTPISTDLSGERELSKASGIEETSRVYWHVILREIHKGARRQEYLFF